MGRKKLVRTSEPPSKRGIAWPRWTGFRNKTVWDFLQLLIVPLMLAALGFWFTAQQDHRQQQVEEQRAQDAALEAYFDQMSTLLIDKDLRSSDEGSEVRTLARARTLTLLGRMDPSRKADVMQFLMEAELVQGVEGTGPIIGLFGADLSRTNLSAINLKNANIAGANLSSAVLRGADLSGANLNGANLSDADLSDADLSGAILVGANLSNTNLKNANLKHALETFTQKELDQTATLEGATMPNGQKYEDWLKDKKAREEGE